MKIKTKLLIIFLCIFLISISVMGGLFYFFSEKYIKKEVNSHLQTTAQSRAEHIKYFLEEQENKLNLLATEPTFLNFIKANPKDSNYKSLQKEINKRIQEINKGIGVFDSKGIVLVAENNPPGTDYSNTSFFQSDMNSTKYLMYYDIERENYNIGIIAPIKDKNNTLLGAIGFDVQAEGLFDIITDTTGLGKTGESYLINKDKYMISPSRFEKDVIFKKKVESKKAHQCYQNSFKKDIKEETKNPNVYYDYRGKEVLGTYYYVPKTNWCMLVEIDATEAQHLLSIIRTIILTTSLLIFLLGILVFFFVSRTISQPIKKLKQKTREIKKGNLNKKCKIRTNDEIGELSESFDEMRLAIKDRNDLLESLLKSFKGKFGNIATILARKNVEKLLKKNPRTEKILPKSLKKTIKKAKKIKNGKKEKK